MFSFIKDQFDWLKSFFSEKDGKGSSKRLITITAVAVFLVTYLKISWALQAITDIPPTWAVLILGAVGLGIVAKKISGNGKNGNGE